MNLKEKFAQKAKEKKELSPKQQKVRSILNWVATGVCIVVIVFALVVAIFTIAGATNDDHLTRFGDKIYLNVATDSMAPTFSPDDVIIATALDSANAKSLKVGQVVTFRTTVSTPSGRYQIFNTHRIVAINRTDAGEVSSYTTRGDKQSPTWQEVAAELLKEESEQDKNIVDTVDKNPVQPSDIVATWGSVNEDGTFTSGKMLKGVGGFSNWIQDTANFGASQKVRFFCVVVLPLILLFVIYAFVLIRTIVIAKLENQRKVQAQQVVTVDSLSDEEKRRLAQEYLASLQQGGDSAQSGDDVVLDDKSQESDAPASDDHQQE